MAAGLVSIRKPAEAASTRRYATVAPQALANVVGGGLANRNDLRWRKRSRSSRTQIDVVAGIFLIAVAHSIPVGLDVAEGEVVHRIRRTNAESTADVLSASTARSRSANLGDHFRRGRSGGSARGHDFALIMNALVTDGLYVSWRINAATLTV